MSLLWVITIPKQIGSISPLFLTNQPVYFVRGSNKHIQGTVDVHHQKYQGPEQRAHGAHNREPKLNIHSHAAMLVTLQGF